MHGQCDSDPSRWSNSQFSELRPAHIPEETADDGASFVTDSAPLEYPLPRRQRAHSFSTISERRSSTESTRPGEFRIVIDRSRGRPRSAGGSSHPTLEVPIPHYRLGTPQFNAAGSAALHSSVYTMTSSLSDNRQTSRFLRDSIDTPPRKAYVAGPLPQDRPSFAASMFSGTAAIDLSKGCGVTENSVFYELKEPVVPAIFEALGSGMDDESVVRYVPGTKDISAATPVRIVAQVSSESFMDYELVSDFFLTFRSYLSTSNLLSLLLARLQWAINRLQPDGRIIRIRTFAALRHWILNYFVDDFATNYDLRCRFCETINSLYNDVKARDGGGTSDLKILIDLKRCWQGKSSLYGKPADLVSVYHIPHTAILPGDISLGADRPYHHKKCARSSTDTPKGASHGANVACSGEVTSGQHDRNNSASTAKTVPVSSPSEQSVQATSCSLPAKHISMSFPYQKAPRPVPLTLSTQATNAKEQKPVSPIISKHHHIHGHAHKRSGSFSDSVRDDRTPLPSLEQQGDPLGQDMMNAGSLIRGDLYPPSESCMTMMAPPSPPLPSFTNASPPQRQNSSDDTPNPGSANSSMKTIIGSIRRALNSRNYGQSISSRAAGPLGPSLRGKTSAVPAHVALGSNFYRNRKMAALSKKPPRIDVLCDKTLKQYREATGHCDGKADLSPTASTPRLQGPLAEPGSDVDATTCRPAVPGHTGGRSQITGGSESIVIVDDTGLDIPIMSGAAGEAFAGLDHPPSFLNAGEPSAMPRTVSLYEVPQKPPRAADEYSLPAFMPVYYDNVSSIARSHPSSSSHVLRPSASRRSLSASRGTASWMKKSLSHSLRKYASFQSGISRYKANMGSETRPSLDLKTSRFNDEKPPGPILRRRPGGYLRKMQGTELEAHLDQGSFMFAHSFHSSTPDSTLARPGDRDLRPETDLIPPNPRLSSMPALPPENTRRSFEDAIARFAQIPDDDDGGVESTLLKLEGKWQGPVPDSDSTMGLEERQYVASADDTQQGEQKRFHNQQHILGRSNGMSDTRHRPFIGEDLPYSQVRGRLAPPRPYSDSVAESEESYSSIPLLERGLTDESMKRPQLSRVVSTPASRRTRLGGIPSLGTSDMGSSHPSIDVVKETESLRGIPLGSTQPDPKPKASRHMTGRFSGVSSDVSVDVIDRREALEERQSMDTNSLGESTFGMPTHPLAHPPSPPMTIQNPRSLIACATPRNPALPPAQLLTPDPSPRNKGLDGGRMRSMHMQEVSNDVVSRSESDRRNRELQDDTGVDHVPFILSCESHVLAQQLTLVEMAALREVDWRDLVEMRWSASSPSTLSWVQFLFEEERRGIDLVVGRFNLMVRWVLSEIVLTQDIYERARTITKFIHTAVHAKRLCNYATMLQITIALFSTDCSRLERTWAHVPEEERNLFKDMESLIQPVRNFHDLRVEMETANLQEGCIPFVGRFIVPACISRDPLTADRPLCTRPHV